MAKPELKRISEYCWQIEPFGKMRVPGVIFADHNLINDIDEKTMSQVCNVAALPGIIKASFAMPDAHMGYGFCIGGVAAFDPDDGGVISGGGVGFDIACGVRTLHTGLSEEEIAGVREKLAESLFRDIPAGVGSTGNITLNIAQLDNMLAGGAVWAVEKSFGTKEDLDFIEEGGCIKALYRQRSHRRRKNASRSKWARSVQAIIILKCKRSLIFMTNRLPKAMD
jgi:tRNA-splicing ligase RtcB